MKGFCSIRTGSTQENPNIRESIDYCCWKNERKFKQRSARSYQVPEARQTNFVQRGKWPSSYEVPVKIEKESWKPSNHDFMIQPPIHQLPQHELIMLLPQRRQHLNQRHKSLNKWLWEVKIDFKELGQCTSACKMWQSFDIILNSCLGYWNPIYIFRSMLIS